MAPENDQRGTKIYNATALLIHLTPRLGDRYNEPDELGHGGPGELITNHIDTGVRNAIKDCLVSAAEYLSREFSEP